MTDSRSGIAQGDTVWLPPDDVRGRSQIGRFLQWLESERQLVFATYEDLWAWSISDLENFWSAVWQYFDVKSHTPYERVLFSDRMPGAQWFPGARLNYAEHAMGNGADLDRVALLGRSQTRPDTDLTFRQLRDQVARASVALQAAGVKRGDRVVGYLPNVPEAVIAFLATASLGATWASCAMELGPRAVIDRFAQIEPVVLICAGGYRYGKKDVARADQVAEIRRGLPTVRTLLDIEYGTWRVDDADSWPLLLKQQEPRLDFVPVPFDHPLVVLFSSGTTGKPKPIIHGHGGVLLEHLKNHVLSWDLSRDDRMLWYTTTSWMMWNSLVSVLLVGASAVLVDGDPAYPNLTWQWRLAAETDATFMGVSPGYVMACRKEGTHVNEEGGLRLRVLGSAGAPLAPEGYGWLQEELGTTIPIIVGSGGTDVCSAIVQNNPMLPIRAGEISGRCLGVAAYAFDEAGRPVTDELGELVIIEPMPSMPVGFWGDHNGNRLRSEYFQHYPGVWRHGDWVMFHADGSCRVAGRSDATLNRGGVRLGTAEFYRVVEEIDGVSDSLVVHLEDALGGNGQLLLFLVLEGDALLDDAFRLIVINRLRTDLSPRHLPDQIRQVVVIPRNLVGKKLELPVKRILQGAKASTVASPDGLLDAGSLETFERMSGE